jgi:alpha-amylase
MKTICLYFQVHQPFRLRRYRFFDIGNESYYYDDFSNKSIVKKIADKCYLPANNLIYELIKKHKKKFRVAYSISGIALDQFEKYAPQVIDSFKKLNETGCVEFLSETYSHSLVSLRNMDEFEEQVRLHSQKIEKLFGVKPTVFRNTELVYSDSIGEKVYEMGFKGMMTEGAKHVLGWKSPNYLYYCAFNPKLKLLLRNYKLSDDIAFRFSNKSWAEWPLTTEKFAGWLNEIPEKEEVVNLFMDYETFGEHQWAETGVFDFLKALPTTILTKTKFGFSLPSEVVNHHQPVAPLHVPHAISWADEERDLSAWLGNELQNEAFTKLYSLTPIMKKLRKHELYNDWIYLQTSDHFYYMCTKFFSDGDVHKYFNPYDSPYSAFINYMNVLSDFIERVKVAHEEVEEQEQAHDILKLENLIREYEFKLNTLKQAQLKEEKSKKEIRAIDKTKPEAKVIAKTKTLPTAIDTTMPKIDAIDRTKPEPKAISTTKKKVTEISGTKPEMKPLPVEIDEKSRKKSR